MFDTLTIVQMALTGLAALIIFLLGNKTGKYFADRRARREMTLVGRESQRSNEKFKKLLKEENIDFLAENNVMKASNQALTDTLQKYREKVAGMGLLSFSGGKKRAEILYSLLLENETLVQLLSEQGESGSSEKRSFLLHQMKDTEKKQRLLARIFNDSTIKKHVKEVLANELKMEQGDNTVRPEIMSEQLPVSEEKVQLSKN